MASLAHGRTTLRTLVQSWNKTLQKEMEHGPLTKTDAASAFLASLEEPKLTSLADAAKKPPIEILPPGMPSIDAPLPGIQKKNIPPSMQQPAKPLQIQGPTTATAEQSPSESGAAPPTAAAESGAAPPTVSEYGAAPPTDSESVVAPPTEESRAPPPTTESGVPVPPLTESGAEPTQALEAQTTPDSEAVPRTDSMGLPESESGESNANASVESEHIGSGVPSENQTSNSSSTTNLSDPVSSVNFSSSSVPPAEAVSQKVQVPRPSGVREELPMSDWTL